MSNSSVNTGFAKCFILFMVIVTLLQGCSYLILSIGGMRTDKCSKEARDIEHKPFEFVMFILYFTEQKCGNPVLDIPKANEKYTLEVNWNKSNEITDRFNIFLMTYAVVSALWVVTSLMVLTTLCGALTKVRSVLCYWPWFLAIMAGCVLDAVATGYFVSDIYHTMSSKDYMAYKGITVKDDRVLDYLSTYDSYFVIPAVAMTCISSRMVLIWFLNIFGTIFCLALAKVLSNQSEGSNNNDIKRQRSLTQQHQYHRDQQPPPQQYLEESVLQSQNTPKQASMHRIDNRRSGNIGPSSHPIDQTKAAMTYRNTETHPDRLDYPLEAGPSERPTSYIAQISPITPLNQRYSTLDGTQIPNSQKRFSYELRSQLPWSYTNLMSKPDQQTPTNVYPNLPDADYTLHPQRNDREKLAESNINITQPQSYSKW